MDAEARKRYRESIEIGKGGPFRSVRTIVADADLEYLLNAEEERDRYLSLLKEIATAESHSTEKTDVGLIIRTVTLESIQRHVRQKLEEWGIKVEEGEQG